MGAPLGLPFVLCVIDIKSYQYVTRPARYIRLAQPGLTAGWLAGRRNPVNFRNFKIHYRSKTSTFWLV